MALTISVGFVVDDAIVVVENIYRHIEDGMAPLEAALTGSREIGFTVLSISLSLVAVFIPLLADGRDHRPVVPRIRHHRDGGDRRLGLRVADADADAVRALPRATTTLVTAASTMPSRPCSMACTASTGAPSTSCSGTSS